MNTFILSILLGASLADPWKRPEHIRVVLEPPRKWNDLKREKIRHRFWWDQNEHKAEIQVLSAKGWKSIKKKARSGWISPPHKIGSRFRLRFPHSTRWSEIQKGDLWISPRELTHIAHPHKKFGRPTIIKELEEDLWVGSVDGGLYNISQNRSIGRWEGLPDDRVIALDTQYNQMLVGTGLGAALFLYDQPQRTWNEEFRSPYIQMVDIVDDDLWIGSYRGLYRSRGGSLEELLFPHSVFALAHDPKEGQLVGYEGLHLLRKDDSRVHFPDWGNVYDVSLDKDTLWLSSNELGVVSIQNQIITPYYPKPAHQLYLDQEGLWLALPDGLLSPKQELETKFGAVYNIQHHQNSKWLATHKGLFDGNTLHPFIPNIRNISGMYTSSLGMLLYNQDQSLQLGKVEPQKWTKTVQGWYPEDQKGAWLDLARREDRLWLLNKEGIWRQKDTKQILLYKNLHITDIEASSIYVWGLSTSGDLFHFSLGKQKIYDDLSEIQHISAGDKSVCVGGKTGLFRVWQTKKEMESLIKGHSFVRVWSTPKGDCYYATNNEQIGYYGVDGRHQVWSTPTRIGKIHTLRAQKDIGVWLHTNRGLWLMRMRN